MGAKALIDAVSSTSKELASDQADLIALQAKVDAKVAEIGDDNTAISDADLALSNFLRDNGPKFVLADDGSISVYAYAVDPPGFTITTATPAD